MKNKKTKGNNMKVKMSKNELKYKLEILKTVKVLLKWSVVVIIIGL